ncbi:diguanylate cyclase domain-containing protein [Pseudomonas anguilliseptica]|uniref:diguanylate cyclase domain-containing protein n=1 Tax=Pseudomonas anguilliseptica TaxID=53406 RepID=UPI0022AE59CA|nr:diguanylate cyclase [Pseudomonas anguilliseptica]MCZ4323296.1 diguanylate cyclase [Pseudomonas anguilliseptica]
MRYNEQNQELLQFVASQVAAAIERKRTLLLDRLRSALQRAKRDSRRQCVRESDTVGRLGGDEFAVIVDNISRQEDATLVAEKIIVALRAPYLLDGHHLISAPSLGIAVHPDHSQSELQLVQQTDKAM